MPAPPRYRLKGKGKHGVLKKPAASGTLKKPLPGAFTNEPSLDAAARSDLQAELKLLSRKLMMVNAEMATTVACVEAVEILAQEASSLYYISIYA